MMRYRTGLFSLPLALLLGVCVSAAAQEESLADIARKTKAKKEQSDSKVWTNADFPEREAPPPPAAVGSPEAEGRSAEQLFAELDQARTDLGFWQQTLDIYLRGVEQERQRLDDADNDYDRETYSRSLDASQNLVIGTEQTIEELQARIAELEKLTQNLQRPPKSPEEEKAEAKPVEIPPELVLPQAGPQPGGEQPEGEQAEAEPPPTP